MKLKEFVITEGKKRGYSLEVLSIMIGKCKSGLRRCLQAGTLQLKDFEKLLNIFKSENIINYNGKNIKIMV